MISPITIATQGVLNSPLSVAAVRGHLRIETVIIVDDVVRGGSSDPAHTIILSRIKREDDEILAIIMASVDLIE